MVKEFHEVEDKYGASGMILTGINQNTLRKTCSVVTLSTTNLTSPW
jgi:hypothetical protein